MSFTIVSGAGFVRFLALIGWKLIQDTGRSYSVLVFCLWDEHLFRSQQGGYGSAPPIGLGHRSGINIYERLGTNSAYALTSALGKSGRALC